MMALVADGTFALGTWVMDSGASHHMTGQAELRTHARQCAPVHSLLADGGERVATTSGTVHLTIEADEGETTLSLLDVLMVPGLMISLFSVRLASACGYEIEFHQNRVLVKHKGTVELQGTLRGKLYVLATVDEVGAEMTAAATPTAEMWHR